MGDAQEWPLLPQGGLPQRGLPQRRADPGLPVGYTPPGYAADDPLTINAHMSSARRDQRWVVPPYLSLTPSMSSVRLDFRDAQPEASVIDIVVNGVMGNVVLIVPEDWGVEVGRLGRGIGTVRSRVSAVPVPGSPIIVVRGTIGMGTFVARLENRYERWRRERRKRQAGPDTLR